MQKVFSITDNTTDLKEKRMVVLTDQKVPQSIYTMETDIYSSQQEEYNIPNILGLDEFSHLEPVPPTSNVQTVSETHTDQRVYESESPKSFVDLDNINGHGISFYDETALNIKPEKDINHVSYNCSMHGMDTTFQVYQQNIKQEDFVFEDIRDSVIRELKEEINATCSILHISPDPIKWSTEDVRKWFVWFSQQYSVPSGIYENFTMSGEQLCQLTDEDFKNRSPEAGSNFYSQLEVWKNACGLEDIECPLSPPQLPFTCYDYSNQGYYNNADVKYMPCSTSPTPSEESLDSTTSSSNMSYIPQPCQEDDYIYIHSPPLRSPVEHEHKQTIHLWQFLKDLLLQPERYNSCIKWIDRQRGIFKIEDSSKVAKLWGMRKNRPAMNYDKLSRSIRQYYKKGIIKKTEHSKRLVYQFCQPYL